MMMVIIVVSMMTMIIKIDDVDDNNGNDDDNNDTNGIIEEKNKIWYSRYEYTRHEHALILYSTIVPISGRSSRIVVLANDDDDADDVSGVGRELLLGAV